MSLLELTFGCAMGAFLIELALNRWPIVVALVVALVARFMVAGSGVGHFGFSNVHRIDEALWIVFGLGFVAALVGSATARGIRIVMQRRAGTP